MKKKLQSILLILFIFFVDFLTKYIFYDKKILSDNYFISPILNKGISWGISIFHFEILIFLIPIVLIFITYMFYKKEIGYYSFIFIISGGIANFIDRLIYHGVRDFIDFHFFPIFNVADIFVSLGVMLIIYELFFTKKINNR